MVKCGVVKKKTLFIPAQMPRGGAANKLEGKWKVSLCLVAPPQAAAGYSTNSSICTENRNSYRKVHTERLTSTTGIQIGQTVFIPKGSPTSFVGCVGSKLYLQTGITGKK